MSLADPNQRAAARELAKGLGMAFAWRLTPQGHDFWHHVHAELEKLGEEPRGEPREEPQPWLP